MAVRNFEAARLFHEMAALLEVNDESRFRVRAYQRAAQTLESLADDVAGVAERGELTALPGIGRELAARIEEYLAIGRIARIHALQPRHDVRILTGTECDILADGRLDFPDDVLAGLDIVLGAVHARFGQTREQMTARIVRALANPHVDILAHPTGRRLGSREPYDVDLEAVFAAARAHGKAVEINASPERLDLADVHARRAAELGVPIAVSTDTHDLSDLDNLDLGLGVARRAWLGAAQVLNARPLSDLLAWADRAR